MIRAQSSCNGHLKIEERLGGSKQTLLGMINTFKTSQHLEVIGNDRPAESHFPVAILPWHDSLRNGFSLFLQRNTNSSNPLRSCIPLS